MKDVIKRYPPPVRRKQIIDEGLRLSAQSHYGQLSRDSLAGAVGITGSSLSYLFGTMHKLRAEIIRAAINEGNHTVIIQAIMSGHPLAKNIPEAVRKAALKSLIDEVDN